MPLTIRLTLHYGFSFEVFSYSPKPSLLFPHNTATADAAPQVINNPAIIAFIGNPPICQSAHPQSRVFVASVLLGLLHGPLAPMHIGVHRDQDHQALDDVLDRKMHARLV